MLGSCSSLCITVCLLTWLLVQLRLCRIPCSLCCAPAVLHAPHTADAFICSRTALSAVQAGSRLQQSTAAIPTRRAMCWWVAARTVGPSWNSKMLHAEHTHTHSGWGCCCLIALMKASVVWHCSAVAVSLAACTLVPGDLLLKYYFIVCVCL